MINHRPLQPVAVHLVRKHKHTFGCVPQAAVGRASSCYQELVSSLRLDALELLEQAVDCNVLVLFITMALFSGPYDKRCTQAMYVCMYQVCVSTPRA